MTVQLHRPDFDPLLDDVQAIVPIARDWLGFMGFCPDALLAISEQCAKEASESLAGLGDSLENAVACAYLSGFTLGVLAERAIDRELPAS